VPVTDLILLPVDDRHALAVRELLPAAFPALGRPADCAVAVEHGRVVGAAAMAWIPNGFPISIVVVPDRQRCGIGRALLSALIARARGETPGLRSWSALSEDEAQARFLCACGFEVRHRLQVFEAEPTAFGNAMTALVARLRSRVPVGAMLAPPDAVAAEALSALLASQLALREAMLNDALSGRNDASTRWDPALSHVLLVDGELAGAILARRIAGGVEVDFNVVAPRWRGGWANALLIEALVTQVRAAGLPMVRFLAEPHVRDTINLSRRAGGSRLADLVVLALPFASPPPPSQ